MNETGGVVLTSGKVRLLNGTAVYVANITAGRVHMQAADVAEWHEKTEPSDRFSEGEVLAMDTAGRLSRTPSPGCVACIITRRALTQVPSLHCCLYCGALRC